MQNMQNMQYNSMRKHLETAESLDRVYTRYKPGIYLHYLYTRYNSGILKDYLFGSKVYFQPLECIYVLY